MATLKHIASKNSDYTAIEAYLVYQHDAFTGKQLLDEQGKPKLRDSYLLDTLECGDFSFATACLLANRKYGKNTQHGDIKSHQYIISFDPRDAANNGLTMEKAQALGLKFCEENFPGHPAIVCTHPDGHNHSGNIHVHIVIGSIRTREVERKSYMQKPRDWREGMKHSSTAQTMRHLRVEVMELCEGAGLYQIDLLNGSKERVSEAEYWARRRGQLKLDRENAALTAAGQPPRQKKFETVKDTLRRQISSVLYRATSFEEFSDRLMQQYGITVKESRGQLSYLPSGRTKFIRAKHLGDKFDKAAVLATLQANAERKPKAQFKQDTIGKRSVRMINLKIDPEFQSQIPPLTDDEFKQLEENILKEGKLISPLIVWNNTLVDGHNRYAILQKHPEIYFSTIPLPFESREEVLAWICKNQLGRRNLTPEQKKFLVGKQYSIEHRKPGGNGNNQYTTATQETVQEELCQNDTIPPVSSETSIRRKIAEQHHVSESYVSRSEKFMKGVEIMEELVPGMQEKILSGQTKIRDADLHRLAKADYIDRQKIVDEILYPERKVEPKPNTNGAAPEPGKAPYMPMLKIESVYDSDAYPKDVRYEYVALENITTRFRTEFDYQLKIMPDTAQREVILEIIHKHKEYLAFLESALAEDAQTA